MEFIESFLSAYWQYVTLVIGAGFTIFGVICNKIKLPGFLTRNPDAILFIRTENSVYITRHWCRIIFSLLHFLWSLIVVYLRAANGNGIKKVGLAAMLVSVQNKARRWF